MRIRDIKLSLFANYDNSIGSFSGDVAVPFTLQSCSKPLTYAMALDTLGPDVVHKYVGTEPSGRNFNELVLDHNSLYNFVYFIVIRSSSGVVYLIPIILFCISFEEH